MGSDIEEMELAWGIQLLKPIPATSLSTIIHYHSIAHYPASNTITLPHPLNHYDDDGGGDEDDDDDCGGGDEDDDDDGGGGGGGGRRGGSGDDDDEDVDDDEWRNEQFVI